MIDLSTSGAPVIHEYPVVFTSYKIFRVIIEEAEIYECSITGCRRRLEFRCDSCADDSLDNIITANNDSNDFLPRLFALRIDPRA